MIDIGGPSLLRAASKNFKFVTPVINPMDYTKLINNIKKNRWNRYQFRKEMAYKVFKEISNYDEK